jgi:hypothetical protein
VLFALACALFRDTLHADTIPAGFDLVVHYSREQVLRAVIRAHQWPFWNPFEFGGFPLWADPQTGLLYPMTLLRGLPVPAFLTWTLLIHVWLFGAGGYALARATGCRRVVATIAGVVLMFGGLVVPRVYAGHVDLVRTAAWTPLILALAIRSFARDRLVPSAALVLALACQLLGGWLQHAVYSVACLSAYALFSVAWPADTATRRRWAPVAQLVSLGLLAAGLTAVQTLPTLGLINAGGRTAGVPFEDAIRSAVPLKELARVMWPPFSGTIPFETWESSAYAGLLLPWLAPLAFLNRDRRRLAVFFALLGTVALIFATGGLAYRLHYLVLPMFRLPGRLIAFWTISVVVTGALGLEWLVERVRVRAAVALILVLAAIVATADVSLYARRFIEPRTVSGRFLTRFPGVVTPGGRVLSLCEDHAQPLELVALGVPSVDGYNPYFLAGMARFASRVRDEAPRRQYMSFPRIGQSPSLPDVSRLYPMNVTEILSCAPLAHESLQLTSEQDGFILYHNRQAPGRVTPIGVDDLRCEDEGGGRRDDEASFAAGTYQGDRFDGRAHVNVVMPARAGLLLSEPYYPERRAFVDGEEVPVTRVFDAFAAICVPAGRHEIELRYVPRRIQAGAAITVMTLAGWLSGLRFSARRPRRQSPRRES